MKSLTLMSASSWPRPITIRWSAVSAISLIRWLETKTVRPSAASCFIRLRTQRMPSGSRPLTGSSKSSTCGSPSSAAAMPRRCPMPSEKPLERFAATSCSPTTPSTSSTRRAGMPESWASAEQMAARAAAAVHRLGVEQRADLAGGVGQLAVRMAADR